MMYSATKFIGLAIGVCTLAACSSGGSTGAPNTVTPPVRAAGMLSEASSAVALEQSLKQGLKSAFDENNTPLSLNGNRVFSLDSLELASVDSAASGDASGFTSTYTLEAGVGEADILKYDGRIMYSLRRSDTRVDGAPYGAVSVQLSQTNPDAADATPLSSIALEGDLSVEGLYLPESGQLVVLQSSGFYGTCGVSWSAPWYWQDQRTRVSFYDTSEPTAPQLQHSIELDGAYTASRQVDGLLYLVSRYTPALQNMPHHYSASDAELSEAQSRIDDVALADLLPNVSANGQEDKLFEPTDCYVPTDADVTPDSASMTTISVIPVSDPQAMQSRCYTGDTYGMYMSTESLYLTAQRYEYTESGSADFSVIHKFDLEANTVAYRGSTEIPGTLGHGEQLDFRLSEHNGLLRVITSEYDYSGGGPIVPFSDDSADAGADSIDHRVTILRESETSVALETVSTLPNESRPAEIGKPDERLYGVRFFAERAYMVTFEQIDPLYVVDLSNPQDPRIAGELEVPGVADFLHPVSDQLLLTLGRNVELVNRNGNDFALMQGLKLELFNVADIENPQSISTLSIGDRGTWSEALANRHAFTFQNNYLGENSNARFAIPVELYQDGEGDNDPFVWNQQWISSGLHLFEINNPQSDSATLTPIGQLITATPDGMQRLDNGFGRRSVFHNDAVYYDANNALWSGFWSDPSAFQQLH
ncbi:MAG: beta-propeller domain-containing protein [Pseudomonadales bacterium]